MVAAAVGVASAVAGLASSKIQANAANKAAKAQGGAATSAEQAQLEAYNQSREDLAPYRGSGYAANNQLSYLLGLKTGGQGGFAGGGQEGVLGAIPSNLANAISGRKIRSPSLSGSDWSDSTYLNLVGMMANASPEEYSSLLSYYGMPAGLSQSDWQTSNTKLQNGDYSPATAPGSDVNNGYGDSVNTGMGDYGSLTKRFSLADYQADPGYQFRLDQGNKAINAAQSARGNFYSGKALKEADAYNSNQASQEYGNAYNRYTTDQNNLYSRLAGVSNQGMGATNTGVSLNQDNASALGNIYGQTGNVNAANSVAQSNAMNQGIGGILSGISSYAKSPSYSSSYVGPGGSNIWGSAYGSSWNNPDSIWS